MTQFQNPEVGISKPWEWDYTHAREHIGAYDLDNFFYFFYHSDTYDITDIVYLYRCR